MFKSKSILKPQSVFERLLKITLIMSKIIITVSELEYPLDSLDLIVYYLFNLLRFDTNPC